MVITLTTDFGTSDYFVGSMKGVILSANPDARIVDISHDIPPQDIEAAAFTLLAAYKSFPKGTVHVAVVDPGVGSSRSPILLAANEQYFVGPDNGLFGYICEREENWQAFQITNESYFRQPVSTTFHGRDVFAPVAAALSRGTTPEELGSPITEFVKLESLVPIPFVEGEIKGRIIHIDNFGNCVTNLTEEHLPDSAELEVNDKEITTVKKFFAEDTKKKSKVFMILGSAGFLELAAKNTSAAKILKAKRGDTVTIRTRMKDEG
jgi:S-adenosyl-L-methionine hydrolase (adenosine-forming)